MKKIFCLAALLGFINHSFAQNTFPTSGNVGIGTTSPSTNLEVLSTAEQLRLSYNTTNNLRFVVNATGNASITPSGGSLFLGGGATITTAGAFYGTNFYNYSNSSNATIGLSTTGTSIIRNIADANSALIINQANTSSTGRIVDFQFGNSSVGGLSAAGHMTLNGGVSATDLRNITSSSNAIIQATTTGTLISRNVADANPALIITQGNAGSAGDILRVRNNAGNQVVVNNNGSVGIGTSTPENLLQVGARFAANASGVVYWGNNITAASPSNRGTLSWDVGKVMIGASDASTDVVFITSGNTERMRILSTGNVGIGTTDTKGYKFAVNGSAVATSMTVKLNSAWPDYVFKKDYKLPTLADVKDYIDKNHHLPDMPSEKEVVDNGLNLGEMNKILTKKVEELTLYLIELNSQLKEQQKEIQELKNKNQ